MVTRFPMNAATLAEAQGYLRNRAIQLLASGARVVSQDSTDEAAVWNFTYQGKTYASIYLLAPCTGQGRYKEIVKAVGLPILTVDDCQLEKYLRRQNIDHVVVDLHPECDSEYSAITRVYGDQRAGRTDQFYMNHIDEGLAVLNLLQAERGSEFTLDDWTMAKRVFCLHPMFQGDADFAATMKWGASLLPLGKYSDLYAVAGAVEYRHVANAHLSKHPPKVPRLSPLPCVNLALMADKVQNRKDFDLYHKGSHPQSDRLDAYFKEWFQVLGISEETYQTIVKDITIPGGDHA
jgi:hypothetical protein